MMKTKNVILGLFLALLQLSVFTGCTKDDSSTNTQSGIIPSKFSVEIPSALANKNGSLKSAATNDTAKGNEIYGNLNTFIFIGQGAAKVVEGIMISIATYGINQPLVMTYTSDDDKRLKNLVVMENDTFEGKAWQYKLTISDAESTGDVDGGKALQVFYNLNPLEGIAIIKPYNCNRVKDANSGNATYRVDYSQKPGRGYDEYMTVQISDIPLPPAEQDPYAINNLKMFVGRTGDIVDVYGNSNHPNAKFFTESTLGFNWAFVASSVKSKNLGVAEVGLPSCSLDETSRKVLLEDNSIKNVLTREIKYVYPSATDEMLAPYLKNTTAPGYFSNHSFVQAGTAPSTDYDVIASRLKDMAPYNPKEISTMHVTFE